MLRSFLSDNDSAQVETLAQVIQNLREERGLSQKALAEKTYLTLNQIQDIEAGIELTLSPSVRQKLARVLKVRPIDIQRYEKPGASDTTFHLTEGAREQWIEEILNYPKEPHYCPACQALLDVRIFERRDLEDNLIKEVKVNCSSCLFKL